MFFNVSWFSRNWTASFCCRRKKKRTEQWASQLITWPSESFREIARRCKTLIVDFLKFSLSPFAVCFRPLWTSRLIILNRGVLALERRTPFFRFLFFTLRSRSKATFAHARNTGHTHLISRFLFFHHLSSSCLLGHRASRLPPRSSVIYLHLCLSTASRPLSLVRHLSFVSFSRARFTKILAEEWPGQLRLRFPPPRLFLDRARSNCGNTITASK